MIKNGIHNRLSRIIYRITKTKRKFYQFKVSKNIDLVSEMCYYNIYFLFRSLAFGFLKACHKRDIVSRRYKT